MSNEHDSRGEAVPLHRAQVSAQRKTSTPLNNGSVGRGQVQNESDEPLLLKILVCVTVTSAGPTQAATLLDPVL